MHKNRKQLIIIHGWAGSYKAAADELLQLITFESFRHNGQILVPVKEARLLRHLLRSQLEIPCYKALCKLILSRFLMSPPATRSTIDTKDTFSSFSEDRLQRDFPDMVIPLTPKEREKHANRLKAEAIEVLAPTLQSLRAFQVLASQHTGEQDEKSMRALLKHAVTETGAKENPIALLEALREMHETGGDLDTVATAVFYALSLRTTAESEKRTFRYGHEFEFVFINYHESLRHLVKYAPADLHAGDLPVAAFPELEEDIRFLHKNDIHTINFDDHHPYDPKRKVALDQLLEEGVLKHLWLSGPESGQELSPGQEKCAADMVYESRIAGTAAECPAAQKLVQAAHGEDFVTNRTHLGRMLTDLIKGGISKTELAQILLAAMDSDTAEQELQKRGWAQQPAIWQNMLQETMHKLLSNATMLTLQDQQAHILCAKAVHSDPDMPKISTGRAIQFLADTFPEADYIFYCFGVNLMVARRLHSDNTLINLGHLMPSIGTSSDGGHAGAAVARPSANPAFPSSMFSQLSENNFLAFSKYLSTRLDTAGYAVKSIQDVSQPQAMQSNHDQQKLLWMIIASVGIGLLAMACIPSFRPKAIRSSNRDFYPHISSSEYSDAQHVDSEVQP